MLALLTIYIQDYLQSKEFKTIVKCINARDLTPDDWNTLVGRKDIDYLDTHTTRPRGSIDLERAKKNGEL